MRTLNIYLLQSASTSGIPHLLHTTYLGTVIDSLNKTLLTLFYFAYCE